MDNLSLNLMDFWDSFIEHSGFSFDQILSIGLYLLHDSHTSKTDVSWSRKKQVGLGKIVFENLLLQQKYNTRISKRRKGASGNDAE